jgi:hypothetical protein
MGNSVRGKLSTADVQLLVVHLSITGNVLNYTFVLHAESMLFPTEFLYCAYSFKTNDEAYYMHYTIYVDFWHYLRMFFGPLFVSQFWI